MEDLKQKGEGEPIAIIAGGGVLPFTIADSVLREGRKALIIGIHGETDHERLFSYNHVMVKWGEIGRLFNILKKHGGRDIVFIGSITKRPDFSSIKLDFGALSHLPKILSIAMGGDEDVLSGTIKFFETRGYHIVGAHEIAPEIILGEGLYGARKPNEQAMKDIAYAMRAAKANGMLDIGQAAIAVNGRVVAVEGAEGTDALIERVGVLRKEERLRWKGQAGVLVKCIRPNQDLRIDLPTIGHRTVEHMADAGLSGIAVEAGKVIAANRIDLIEKANEKGIFIIGVLPTIVDLIDEEYAE